jgi:hypothetical protein
MISKIKIVQNAPLPKGFVRLLLRAVVRVADPNKHKGHTSDCNVLVLAVHTEHATGSSLCCVCVCASLPCVFSALAVLAHMPNKRPPVSPD